VSVKSCLQAEMHAATRCKCQHVAAVSRHFSAGIFLLVGHQHTYSSVQMCRPSQTQSHSASQLALCALLGLTGVGVDVGIVTSTATGWTARAKHSGKAFGGGTERWHGMQVDDTRHERQKQDGGLAATEGTSSFKREGER
jgi:hypothetical protein